MRLIGTAAVALALGALLTASAQAASVAVPSEHFVVHYFNTGRYAVSDQVALQVANDAERAYDTLVVQWGFPAPVPDNGPVNNDRRRSFSFWGPSSWDGKVDIRIVGIRGANGIAHKASQTDNQTPGLISLNSAVATNQTTVTHELFHLIQFAIFAHATRDRLLGEGTATWAAAQLFPTATRAPFSLVRPWVSLDCRSSCGAAERPGGYEHWSFFEFLSERYGRGIIREIFERSRDLGARDRRPHAIESMSAALRAHHSNFTRAFNDFWAANLSGSYTHPALRDKHPVLVGAVSATRGEGDNQTVTVDRLAAKVIKVHMNKSGCRARRVRIAVSLPGGTRSRPTLDFSRSGLESMRVHGSKALAKLRWNPCKRGRSALLMLPNASPTLNHQHFHVSARLKAR